MSPIISRINGTGGMTASMGLSSSKLIFPSPQIFTSTGIAGGVSIAVPNLATSMKFKVWGSGGDGVGEGCGGPYSGGSGGYVEGVYPVSKGQTVTVYVGATGAAGGGALIGYGAGAGGEGSLILYNGSFVAVAGGGGGAGQAGNGGSGGGNGSGGSGTSYTNSSYNGQGGTQSGGGNGGSGLNGANAGGNGSGTSGGVYGGGSAGGTGLNQGNRGGGGGGGYYGGGGGGGGDIPDNNCQSGGGGGGSGFIEPTSTNKVSYSGNTGTNGGAAAVNTSDPYYIAGKSGASQNGLVVIIWQ
jgi:hypothetical protein